MIRSFVRHHLFGHNIEWSARRGSRCGWSAAASGSTHTMDLHEIVLRLGAALLLGGIIGVERQWRQRMAGLRTNALVAIGAAGFVVFSATFPGEDSPTRVAAQIVSGIGFLGAGVILREGVNVRGLNTAATLWCSAMIGTFAGAGQIIARALAAAFVVSTNLFLWPLIQLINKQPFGAAGIETQ